MISKHHLRSSDAIDLLSTLVAGQRDIAASSTGNGCVQSLTSANCDANSCYNENYRTMDGNCNNRNNPLFGAAFTPYIRLLPARYDDGSGAPASRCCALVARNLLTSRICRHADANRPSARDASRFLLSASVELTTAGNALIMQWGQFVSHDVTRYERGLHCINNYAALLAERLS